MAGKNKHTTHQQNSDNNEENIIASPEEIRDKLTEMQDTIVSYAKENPLKVMGFSLLAGALLAQVFRVRK